MIAVSPAAFTPSTSVASVCVGRPKAWSRPDASPRRRRRRMGAHRRRRHRLRRKRKRCPASVGGTVRRVRLCRRYPPFPGLDPALASMGGSAMTSGAEIVITAPCVGASRLRRWRSASCRWRWWPAIAQSSLRRSGRRLVDEERRVVMNGTASAAAGTTGCASPPVRQPCWRVIWIRSPITPGCAGLTSRRLAGRRQH